MQKPDAILLVGPTGSGKTPLGELLERQGLWGRPCRHFDFGRRMRDVVAAGTPPDFLSAGEIEFLRSVLARGALLEDEHFPIAEKILRAFVAEPGTAGALVVLNGLPRHAGQARDVGTVVCVRAVIELACTAEVVLRRIEADTEGDRAGRTDDDVEAVRRKLEIFARRTSPLLEHYRGRGAWIESVRVAADGTAGEVRDALQRLGCPFDGPAKGDAPC